MYHYAFPSLVPLDVWDTVSATAAGGFSVSPHTRHGSFSFRAMRYFGWLCKWVKIQKYFKILIFFAHNT